MNYFGDTAFDELKANYGKINVVDVGAARGAFLVELEKKYDLNNVYAIGIEPFNHGIKDHYDKFFEVCVDNVDSPTEMEFYVNADDQASSLCQWNYDNLSSDKSDDSKFYYSESILNQINSRQSKKTVDVLNLDTIINEEIPEGLVHFIKVDAEGKDLDIVKSLSDETLKRTKFIGVECPNEIPRFEGEAPKQEFIDYFESKNFKEFHCLNYEEDPTNRQPMSDVVFVNLEEL